MEETNGDLVLNVLNNNAITVDHSTIIASVVAIIDRSIAASKPSPEDSEGKSDKRASFINDDLLRDIIRVEIIARMIADFEDHGGHPAITDLINQVINRVKYLKKTKKEEKVHG